MSINKYLSIVTLNVNGLNAPIKRHRMAQWIRKYDPHICYKQETPTYFFLNHLRKTRPTQTECEGLEKNFSKQKDREKPRVALLISEKIDFKRRAIKRDPEGNFIILKGRIHQEDINIVNIYAPNIGAPKYIKKILKDFKKDIDSNTITIGDFNIPLSKMDRSSKQNITKYIAPLKTS